MTPPLPTIDYPRLLMLSRVRFIMREILAHKRVNRQTVREGRMVYPTGSMERWVVEDIARRIGFVT